MATEAPPLDAIEYDRDRTIARIRRALRERTGRSWSVTGGRGTSWGWITVSAPPARRVGDWRGYLSDEDRAELATALDLTSVHQQGVQIPASTDYRVEYVDRAEGRRPRRTGTPYWD